MNRFEGKTVIVTGSGSGIGKATARRFAREGANVVLNDVDADKLRAAAQDFPEDRTLAHAADVSDKTAAEGLVKAACDRFGGIDVLVNNAGIDFTGMLEQTSAEDFDRVMKTDLYGVFYMTQAALPALEAHKGSVINLSSASGIGGDWNHTAYNTAKGAVTNFTRAVAMDYARRGVRVNAVNPTFTKTPLTAEMQKDQKMLDAFAERIPMGRGGEPEEIADVIAFLASEDARFVTGVNLPVDGGLSASNGQPPLG